jgi:hypothetical protein
MKESCLRLCGQTQQTYSKPDSLDQTLDQAQHQILHKQNPGSTKLQIAKLKIVPMWLNVVM